MKVSTNFRQARLESAKARLLLYLEAEQAILTGQEYEIEGLKLTRADLKVVRDTIADLENFIAGAEQALKPGLTRPRFRTIIPRDNF